MVVPPALVDALSAHLQRRLDAHERERLAEALAEGRELHVRAQAVDEDGVGLHEVVLDHRQGPFGDGCRPVLLPECRRDHPVLAGRVEPAVPALLADDVAHRHDGHARLACDLGGLALAAARQSDGPDDVHWRV